MSSQIIGNSRIREAMAAFTTHPEYEGLPESIKACHTAQQFAWLGEERNRIVERETMPDMDVTE